MRFLRENSLSVCFGVLFAVALVGQSVAGHRLVRPDLWEQTLQNWQSEFLAVGAMAVFTIYLRRRGSPESKPVGGRTARRRARASRPGHEARR